MEKKSFFDRQGRNLFVKEQKIQPFRIKQIDHEIFKNGVIDFEEMTTISKDMRSLMAENFQIIDYDNIEIQENPNTTKFLITLRGWWLIEAVLMHHYHVDKETKKKKINRFTLCISCQVWCPVWCVFCVTWKLWFLKNLSWEEIIGQLLVANNYLKKKFGKKEDWSWYFVRNVVFMWMWEPLLNYDAVKKSIDMMIDQTKFSLSRRHVTISTSWVISWIKRLMEDKIDVMLALSLHAPNQKLREELIPTIAKQYPLDELMKTIDEFTKKTWQEIFYEYIMIKDKTDTPELAKQLAKLLHWKEWHLNLIPYNENPVIDLVESTKKSIELFRKILEDRGIIVTVRNSHWRSIKSACGQLWYQKVHEHKDAIKDSWKNLKVLKKY